MIRALRRVWKLSLTVRRRGPSKISDSCALVMASTVTLHYTASVPSTPHGPRIRLRSPCQYPLVWPTPTRTRAQNTHRDNRQRTHAMTKLAIGI